MSRKKSFFKKKTTPANKNRRGKDKTSLTARVYAAEAV